jgi:hypothetical protein
MLRRRHAEDSELRRVCFDLVGTTNPADAGYAQLVRHSISIALPIETLRELDRAQRESDALWNAIAPKGATHEITEHLENGHRCITRLPRPDGSIVELRGESREFGDAGGTHQRGDRLERLMLEHTRPSRGGTRWTRWVYIRGTGVSASHSLYRTRQAMLRARDFYERAARDA